MAKVILICGRICSGKTTYAQKLLRQSRAVLLSCDEITLALFGGDAGAEHDTYVERTQNNLLRKSLEILEKGIDVILDWGFWMACERDEARRFYVNHGFRCEFHGIDISDNVWQERLRKRNSAVLSGDGSAYYVDEGLAKKFSEMYEPPTSEEINLWIRE